MKKFKPAYMVSGIFLCVIIGVMFSAICVYTSRKVDSLTSERQEIEIDWEALYPFETGSKKQHDNKETIIERTYKLVKEKCEEYSSEKLIGYHSIVESAKKYEDVIAWNLSSVFDYNAVVKLHDGYLTGYTPSRDVMENAKSTIGLAEFCRERGIEFFYANLPTKTCVYEDKDISGVLDFANQNVDRFLAMLGDSGVKYYDFRKLLHDDGMKHHEAFYVTDHHWKAETGLWAARHVLRILRDDYGWNVKPEVLNPDNFDYVVYPEWFLGSSGRKITHVRTKPDDFTLIYPKFETLIHYEIPSGGIDTSGDFSITYDMRSVEPKDYYNQNPYAAYNHADKPLIQIENIRGNNGRRILVIHDSVSNCVIPFIAMEIQNVYSIDLRYFTGSIKSFIAKERPDAVVIMYYSTIPGRDATAKTDKTLYDFR